MQYSPISFLVALLFLSGFFSGAEIAMFSITHERIESFKRKRSNSFQRKMINILLRLQNNPQELLTTILLGNNIVNISASALATLITNNALSDNGWSYGATFTIAIVTGVMTFFILFFGEILPKSFAYKHSISFAIMSAPIIYIIQKALFPLIWGISFFAKIFSGGLSRKTSLTEEELKLATELSAKDGNIQNSEHQWVHKILELGDRIAEDVMTPSSKVFAASSEGKISEFLDIFKVKNFSRVPIFRGSLDNVIGIVTTKILLNTKNLNKKISSIPMLTPIKIPLTMRLDKLFQKFQNESQHMAIVFDEHGGTIGIVTLEDVLEEIFGEIQDEEDAQENKEKILRQGRNNFIVSGETEVKYLIDKLSSYPTIQKIIEGWEGIENETLAFLILENIGRMPKKNEIITFKDSDSQKKIILKATKINQRVIQEISVEIKN